jgi:TRAP-type C4-dicarboxylate transport system permease large subunit
MNRQSANPTNPQENFELKIRTMRTLWMALLTSIGLYYGLTVFAGPREEIESSEVVSLILVGIALSTILPSFLIKSKLLARAVEQQQVQLVQQAYIVAWALTETAAILGLLDFFLTGHRHYYILFIIAALGLLLHFPRRDHVANASPKIPIV